MQAQGDVRSCVDRGVELCLLLLRLETQQITPFGVITEPRGSTDRMKGPPPIGGIPL